MNLDTKMNLALKSDDIIKKLQIHINEDEKYNKFIYSLFVYKEPPCWLEKLLKNFFITNNMQQLTYENIRKIFIKDNNTCMSFTRNLFNDDGFIKSKDVLNIFLLAYIELRDLQNTKTNEIMNVFSCHEINVSIRPKNKLNPMHLLATTLVIRDNLYCSLKEAKEAADSLINGESIILNIIIMKDKEYALHDELINSFLRFDLQTTIAMQKTA